MSSVRYFVLDIETVADGQLVQRLRYPGESLSPREAVARYRAELLQKYDSDFIPYTYQVPVSVAIAKIDEQFRLMDLVALDEPQYRPHVITEHFWRGWERYDQPTLVTFNGRGFDIPNLELSAFRFGVSVPGWFHSQGPTYKQPRNRYNTDAHIDLQDLLTNFGATRFNGGLHLAANLLGKPGKMDVEGHMVQDLFEAGKLKEVNDYCRCDVLDTYFVFLRSRVLIGQLALEDEHRLVAEAKDWITARASTQDAFQLYLRHWGDWRNPNEFSPLAQS